MGFSFWTIGFRFYWFAHGFATTDREIKDIEKIKKS